MEKRQRRSLILLSMILILLVVGLLYIGLLFYEQGQPYIRIIFNDNSYIDYSFNENNFRCINNGSVEIYDKKTNDIIITYYKDDYMNCYITLGSNNK